MKLTTTINRIKQYDPDDDRFNLLIKVFFNDKYPDEEVNILNILDHFFEGIENCLLLFPCVIQEQKLANQIALSFAIQCAERVLHIFEKEEPNDNRPRLAIKFAKDILYKNNLDAHEVAKAYANHIPNNDFCIPSAASASDSALACGLAAVTYNSCALSDVNHDYITCSAVSAANNAISACDDEESEIKAQREILRSLLQDD